MKTVPFLMVAGLALALQTTFAADDKPAESVLKTQKEKLSYAFGMNIGSSIKAQGVDIDLSLLTRGIQDTIASNKMLLTQQEMQEAFMAWQAEMRNKRNAQAEENKKKGEAFLAENAKKPGVVVLPSGLQYKVITSGNGTKSPASNDVVKAHYKGTLIDGTEFDSSYTRGQPFNSPANRVIPGWTEALLKMKPGDKWQLFVPGNLAYGERGRPPKIGPNAVLIFEMEMIDFEPPKEQPKSATSPIITLPQK